MRVSPGRARIERSCVMTHTSWWRDVWWPGGPCRQEQVGTIKNPCFKQNLLLSWLLHNLKRVFSDSNLRSEKNCRHLNGISEKTLPMF